MNIASNAETTTLNSLHYEVLAIVLSRVEFKSIESYRLRSTCPRIQFVLQVLLHHPCQISAQCKLPYNFCLYDNFPTTTFNVGARLQSNALGRGHWESFEYLQKIHTVRIDIGHYHLQMMWAVIRASQVACFEKLLSKYITPTRELFDQVLYIAAECGSMQFVEYAVANIITGERGSMTLVEYAKRHFTKFQHQYCRSFCLAVFDGHIQIVTFFASIGVNINNNDNYICGAAENGHFEVVEFLLSMGANVHAKNDRPILQAAENGHLRIVKLLLSAGANVRANNDFAIRMAVRYNHLEVVKFLLSINNKMSIDENTILAVVKSGHVEMMRYICSVRPNIIQVVGDDAVRIAVIHNRVEMLQLLHSLGVNLLCSDSYALYTAAQNGQLEILEYFFLVGIDINANNDFALGLAASNGCLEVVKFLVSIGANIDARKGYAMEMATRYNHTNVVEFLKSIVAGDTIIKV